MLTDLLLDFQKQGLVAQIGFLVAIVSALLGPIAWVVWRLFRRGYERIDGQNVELRTAIKDYEKAIAQARRDQGDLQHAVDLLHARLPDTALALAERKMREGRREIALEQLQDAIAEVAPGFAEGCFRLAEFVLPLSIEPGGDQYLAEAERYARLAAVLDLETKDAPAMLAEIEAKKAAASVDHGEYVKATGHADAALEYVGSGSADSTAHLVDRISQQARRDYVQGFYYSASVLYRRAIVLGRRLFGSDHQNTLTLEVNLATTLKSQGRYAEARPLYERALAIREKALGPEHPDVATSLNNLAGLHRTEGRYAEARPLYERALAILEKALGPEHFQTRETKDALHALG